jgi:hypothetical protein
VLPDERRDADLRDADLRDVERDDVREALRCERDAREMPDFFGTFAPDLRASDNPMAMACLRLVTFFPLRPLFSVPLFRSRIARSTFWPAFGLYLRPPVDFFVAAIVNSPFLSGKRSRRRGLRWRGSGQ